MANRNQILSIPCKFFVDATVPRISFEEPWESAARKIKAYSGPMGFAVDDGNTLVGIVLETDINRFLHQGGTNESIPPGTTVGRIMRPINENVEREILILDTAPVQQAIQRLEALDSLIVVDTARHPIGLLTRASIARSLEELDNTQAY